MRIRLGFLILTALSIDLCLQINGVPGITVTHLFLITLVTHLGLRAFSIYFPQKTYQASIAALSFLFGLILFIHISATSFISGLVTLQHLEGMEADTNFLHQFALLLKTVPNAVTIQDLGFLAISAVVALALSYAVENFLKKRANEKYLSFLLLFCLIPSNANPYWVWVSSFFRANFSNANEIVRIKNYDHSLLFGQPVATSLIPSLPDSKRNKPNIVWVILESVGSVNLIDQRSGLIRKDIAPFLNESSAHAFVAPKIYNTFPATTRSHLALMTGGLTLTRGNVFKELNYPYTGYSIVRSLKQFGYRTGLFSANYIDFENLVGFYKSLPWDRFLQPADLPDDLERKLRVHAWAIDERYVAEDLKKWTKDQKKKPWFALFLTGSTHYPYGDPIHLVDEKKSKIERYQDAIRFTDATIQDIWKSLGEESKNTVLIVTGDHGQGFADLHPGNIGHKNRIYEENIRNFLWVYDPNHFLAPLVWPRSQDIGDVPQMISEMLKLPTLQTAVLKPEAKDKMHFFHKLFPPEEWGVVDGKWKWISSIDPNKEPVQLYDLENDPNEQKNISNEHPEMNEKYRARLDSWYLAINEAFIRNLNKRGKQDSDRNWVTSAQWLTLTDRGPAPTTTADPESNLAIGLTFNPSNHARLLSMHWVSPSGRTLNQVQLIPEKMKSLNTEPPFLGRLEEGVWQLSLIIDQKIIRTEELEVRSSGIAPQPQSNSILIHRVPFLTPNDIQFEISANKKQVLEQFKSLSVCMTNAIQQAHCQNFRLDAKTLNYTLKPPKQFDLGKGTWTLEVYNRRILLNRASFNLN